MGVEFVLVLLFLGFKPFLVTALLWLCVSTWVTIDASTNSSYGGSLWGATVFFGGIAGLLLYVDIGRDVDTSSHKTARTPDLVECPHCRATEEAGRDFCRFCDEPLRGS